MTMNPSTRFLIIMIAMFAFFVSAFFLTGVYYVKKGKRLILEKKGHYLKNVGPGLYFFLPILYEAWDFYFEGSATYTVKCGKAKVVYVGELQDPEAYVKGGKTAKKRIREVLKNKGEDVPLSLQIKDQLNQNGWEVGSVLIER
jgi:hypothetical protein